MKMATLALSFLCCACADGGTSTSAPNKLSTVLALIKPAIASSDLEELGYAERIFIGIAEIRAMPEREKYALLDERAIHDLKSLYEDRGVIAKPYYAYALEYITFIYGPRAKSISLSVDQAIEDLNSTLPPFPQGPLNVSRPQPDSRFYLCRAMYWILGDTQQVRDRCISFNETWPPVFDGY